MPDTAEGYAKNLLLIYQSQSGRNRELAEAAFNGAALEEGVHLRLLRAHEAGAADLMWADGLLLLTPENFGYLSGALKDFFDRTFYRVEAHQINLPYALIVCCGNDGSNAVNQLQRMVKAYPLKAIADPVIIKGEPQTSDFKIAEETGQALAAGLGMGVF